MNCDGLANLDDVTAFVGACNGQAAYEAVYPYCNWLNGDCNGDGTVDPGDVNCFIDIINQPDSGVIREYAWDAENRLGSVWSTALPDPGDLRYRYAYDYLDYGSPGRTTRARTAARSSVAGSPTAPSSRPSARIPLPAGDWPRATPAAGPDPGA